MYCTKWLKFYASQRFLSRISLTASDAYMGEGKSEVAGARELNFSLKFVYIKCLHLEVKSNLL